MPENARELGAPSAFHGKRKTEASGMKAVPEDLPQDGSTRPAFPLRPLPPPAHPTLPGAPRTWPPATPAQPCWSVSLCLVLRQNWDHPAPGPTREAHLPSTGCEPPSLRIRSLCKLSGAAARSCRCYACSPLSSPFLTTLAELPRGGDSPPHLLALTSKAQCRVCWGSPVTC